MILSAAMMGVLGSCSAGLPTKAISMKTSFETRKDVVYSPPNWPEEMKGDIYQPKTDGLAPGILLIHGGGWTGGDKRHQMSAIARRLAKRGFVVFNVTYRTTPEWEHPAQYKDLIEALKWMKKNELELNLDSSRLATLGYSAGGHLAALVGLQAEKEGILIRAIVAGGAPSDLTLTESPLVEALLGGNRDEIPARHREASPATHVSSQSPPVFLYHARKDKIVWPDHALLFQKKLIENGISHELVWTLGRGHISGFLFPGKAISHAVAFLDQHLKAEL